MPIFIDESGPIADNVAVTDPPAAAVKEFVKAPFWFNVPLNVSVTVGAGVVGVGVTGVLLPQAAAAAASTMATRSLPQSDRYIPSPSEDPS
jgi:hypothetical protein